jgi:prophage regulatory protein
MEISRKEHPPKTIIRLAEVLRRTGFSRSTIYILIAKKEFPPQVPLGARSVGWVEEEVDAWIAHRANMRPASESQSWIQNAPSAPTLQDSSTIAPPQNKSSRNSSGPRTTKIDGILSVPDLAQLELIGTNVYVDKTTGSLWFQVLRPK